MITNIHLENFKSIKKAEIELRPINILIGSNGAGKSNFLSFFKLLHSLFTRRLDFYIGNNINTFLYYGRRQSKFIHAIVNIDNTTSLDFSISPAYNKNTGYISDLSVAVMKEHKKNVVSGWKTIFEERDVEISQLYALEDPQAGNIQDHLDNLWLYHFQDVTEGARIKLPSKINDNRSLHENGSNLAAFLYFLQERHSEEFKAIEQQIKSVAPFFSGFDLEPDRLSVDLVELRWREKNYTDYFNAYDFSDGTLRYVALVTLLLQPNLPKTIIIDEPELGLHPFAVNKLAALIKQASKRGSQVVVSTQSVELLNNFEPDDVIAVNREENQSTFKRLDSDVLNDWLEEYTIGDLWNKNVIGARP